MSEVQKLTDLFRRLGATDPEGWATSQVNEGINQIGRFVFLKEAWSRIVGEDDSTWIDSEIEASANRPDAPFAGVGHALLRLKELGATGNDINEVVRGKQAELLFALCVLLDDPGELPDEAKDISWCLVQIDAQGKIIAPISELHESVLDTDPSGREMRPRKAS